MGLKLAGARLLLKGGLLNRTNYVSARSAEATEYASTVYAEYARVAIALAAWTRSDAGLAENTAALNFPTPGAADATVAPTHWGLHTALTGGDLLLTAALNGTPAAPRLGASFGFDAGMCELTRAAGAVTALGMKRAYETGLVSGTTYLGVFSELPSAATDVSDALSVDAMEAVAAAGWVENTADRKYVRNNALISFGVQNEDQPRPTHVGLFDGSNLSSANLLWEDQLDSQADDPGLGATISIAQHAVSIGFTIDT